jgi:hypothetical protein
MTNGSAEVTITDLPAGDHNATVTFMGNDLYDEATITKEFTTDESLKLDVNGTGNSTIVEVKVPGNSSNGTVTIIIDGQNYTANVTNGTAKVDLGNVTPGVHNATVVYVDGNNKTSEIDTTIAVPKWNASVNATAQDIMEGYDEVISIKVLPEDVTGIALVDIDGMGYYVNLTNGAATLTVKGLKAGSYTAKVTYSGDDKYNNATTTAAFTVSKPIVIDTNGSGNNTDVVIELPENTTGNVTVIIDNQTYYVENNTNGTVVIPVGNLTPGTHDITVKYVDENGTESVVNDTITISLYDTPITIEVADGLVGDTIKVTVTVPDGVEGSVTIEIDGVAYTKQVTAGKAVFDVDGLLAGDKTVTATYAGDKVYSFNSTTANFTVSKRPAPISVTVDNSTQGKVTVTVDLPADATGYVIVNVNGIDYGINLTDGNSAVIPIVKTDDYTATVNYLGDHKYLSNSTSDSFHAYGMNTTSLDVEVKDTAVGEDVEVKVTVPEGSSGNVTVIIDNETKTVPVTSGENIISVPGVGEGTHNVTVIYTDNETGTNKTVVRTITVFESIVSEKELTRGWNSPYDYKAEFLDNEGHILVNTDVQFIVNGKTYTVKTDEQGIAYLDANLDVGKYNVEIINPVTGARTNATTTIVKRLVENKDITMDFADGTKYVVRAIGDDGKPVGAGEVVKVSANGVNYAVVTDSNGYAKLTINLNPKTYTITAQFRAFVVSNKLVVKQTLKLAKKTITVKKSAKSFKIKATLKWSSGKAIKGKKITINFKGKNYKVKTNSKGVAQVTIKKSVIKKLKAGKKYSYYAKYLTNKVKGTVKVKK